MTAACRGGKEGAYGVVGVGAAGEAVQAYGLRCRGQHGSEGEYEAGEPARPHWPGLAVAVLEDVRPGVRACHDVCQEAALYSISIGSCSPRFSWL